MRRLMAATATMIVLFLAAACEKDSGDSGTTGGASSAAPAATSASPTANAAANTKQVCTDVKQLNTEYAARVKAVFERLTQEALRGDATAGEKSTRELSTLGKEWAAKLETQAAKASDPELRKTISDIATAVKRIETGEASMNDTNQTIQNAATSLAKFCG